MDAASLAKLNLLHPKIRSNSIAAYDEACEKTPVGIHPYIVQTYRTFDESDELYKLGRTVVNPDGKTASRPMGQIVSNAPGGYSWHNYALALDFGLLIDGKVSYKVDENWMIVVNIFKKYGFNWGGEFPGSFKDYPHLECKLGHTIQGLLQLHAAGKFIPGTTYLNI